MSDVYEKHTPGGDPLRLGDWIHDNIVLVNNGYEVERSQRIGIVQNYEIQSPEELNHLLHLNETRKALSRAQKITETIYDLAEYAPLLTMGCILKRITGRCQRPAWRFTFPDAKHSETDWIHYGELTESEGIYRKIHELLGTTPAFDGTLERMKLSEIIVIKCAVLQINEELSLDVASWILPSTKKQRCRCVLHWRGNHYEKLHAIQYLPNFMVVPAMSNTNAALLDTHMDLVIDLEDTTKSLINSNGEVHIDVKMHDSMYRSFSYLLS